MAQLQLSFLGGFQVNVDGAPVSNWRSVKIQGLLVYLALTPGQTHARERLAALFWPDAPDVVAKKNLRQALYRLRKLLGAGGEEKPFLTISRTTVQWNLTSKVRLDVADFLTALERRELETAVSLYTGDLLPSLSCDSQPFAAWLHSERERLQRLALDALSTLTEQHLAQANDKKAETMARHQLRLAPWREAAHRQLMQALALQGKRSAAIAQYEVCQTVLEDELGIEPSAETQALAAAIAHQQLAANDSRNAGFEAAHPRLSIPFVGRQAEFEQLVASYRRVINDGLQLVTLAGRAGIGKTRLAQQFLRWAATQQADPLHGRAYETSIDLSYQPIIQLFRQRLERENAPEDLLSDLWLAQLTRLWPELRERYPDLPQPTQEEKLARQHLFEAIARLGLALSERAPLLLFIDDAQWLDAASRDALQFAVARWSEAQAPILLMLTVRQEGLAEFPETQQWLTNLRRHGSSNQLNLRELSEQETARLIEQAFAAGNEDEAARGDKDADALAQLTHWLFAETAGQPLFLTEALKALVDEGLLVAGDGWEIDWGVLQKHEAPTRVWQGVQEIVRGWLQRLSEPAGGLLAATAVLVEAASFDHLTQVAGLDELEALTALDELLNRQMLVESSQGFVSPTADPVYGFAHQKIQDVVYAEAGAARRRLLHRRAFKALKASAFSAAELAHHAHRAGLTFETVHHSLMAGNEAMAVFAAEAAIHHYQTAFQMAEQKGWPDSISGADRQALYLGLGQAHELSEKTTLAQGIYEELVAYARQIGSPAMECIGLNQLAQLYNMALLDTDKAFELLAQARQVAEKAGDSRGLAETLQNLALAAGNVYDFDSEKRYSEQALALARELGHPQLLAGCLRRMAYTYAARREWEKCGQVAIEAQQRLEEIGNTFLANDVQRLVGGCHMQNGRAREGLKTLQQANLFIQQVESKWEQADVARFLAHAYIELGQYGEALRLAREAVEMTRQVNHPMVTIPLIAYGEAHLAVRSLTTAQEVTIAVREDFYPFPDEIPAKLCAIHALKGEWAQAHEYAKQVLTILTDSPFPPMDRHGWYETEALLRGGDDALARAEVARIATVIGSNRRYRLPLLRSQAVLAQWDGDVTQAVTHLENALTLAQEMELPGEEWPILGELGKLYAGQGKEAKSREAYKKAGTIIHRLAGTIDDEGLREGFLTAVPIQSILQHSETT